MTLRFACRNTIDTSSSLAVAKHADVGNLHSGCQVSVLVLARLLRDTNGFQSATHCILVTIVVLYHMHDRNWAEIFVFVRQAVRSDQEVPQTKLFASETDFVAKRRRLDTQLSHSLCLCCSSSKRHPCSRYRLQNGFSVAAAVRSSRLVSSL